MNDSPTSFFSNPCGLRQGNPLSPLLIVIVMEALDKIISVAVSGGMWSSFSVGTGLVSPILYLLMIHCFSVGLT